MNELTFFLALIYITYVTFESFGGLARFGGFQVGFISVGLSLQNQILSLNRFVGFLIAPLVGYFSDSGGTMNEIFWIGLGSSLVGGICLVLVYFKWCYISELFASISICLVERGYDLRSILLGFNRTHLDHGIDKKKIKNKPLIKFNYIIAQAITTGLAMPSIFVLNIIALKIPDYSSMILQMATAISGFGNLILNFYTNPLLAVEESKLTKYEIEATHKSIFLGKIIGMLIFAPIVICTGFAF